MKYKSLFWLVYLKTYYLWPIDGQLDMFQSRSGLKNANLRVTLNIPYITHLNPICCFYMSPTWTPSQIPHGLHIDPISKTQIGPTGLLAGICLSGFLCKRLNVVHGLQVCVQLLLMWTALYIQIKMFLYWYVFILNCLKRIYYYLAPDTYQCSGTH